MERILETESIDNQSEVEQLDLMTRKYIYVLNEAMARAALSLGIVKGLVLEIGVGPARIATQIIRYNPQLTVIGIDLSNSMFALARRNIKDAGIDAHKIILTRADAKLLPFKSQAFDLIISQNMLHHLPDPLPMLKEVQRVLKPEGALLIRDVVRPGTKFTAQCYASIFGLNYTPAMWQMYYNSMCAGFTVDEIKMLCTKAGLEGAAIQTNFLTHYSVKKHSPRNQQSAVPVKFKRWDVVREMMMRMYV